MQETNPNPNVAVGREDASGGSGWRGATHWSVVLLAGQSAVPGAAQALEQLCRTYWHPIYVYVRRCGYDATEAQDLTQSFFAHLLKTKPLRRLDQAKGRFRSFLLVSLKHFLANEWDRARAQKRGGGQPLLSLDETLVEERYCAGQSAQLGPDLLYDKRWALALLDLALKRLQAEEIHAGRGEEFKRLQVFLTADEPEGDYRSIGAALGLSREAIAMAVHRLRRRFRHVLQAEIALTVAGPEQVEEELRSLMAALRAG